MEHFEYIVNASLALRKITSINVYNPEGRPFQMRPQLHVFFCQPYGSGKSSVFKQIRRVIGDDCIIEDDFTMPGFLGSVDKHRCYVPGEINDVGGKVMCIDEWNNLNTDARHCLLSVLENNTFKRKLGYALKDKDSMYFKDEFTDITVDKSSIRGSVYFTCIAGAMFFPKEEKINAKVKEEALLSRFMPHFREFELKDYMKLTRGSMYNNFEDYCAPGLRVVNVKPIRELHKAYWDHLNSLDAFEQIPSDRRGYASRVWMDFIRFGVFNYIREHNVNKRLVTIRSPRWFLRDMEMRIGLQLAMYIHKDLMSNYELFVLLSARHPDWSTADFMRELDVTERTIRRYRARAGMSVVDSEEVVS